MMHHSAAPTDENVRMGSKPAAGAAPIGGAPVAAAVPGAAVAGARARVALGERAGAGRAVAPAAAVPIRAAAPAFMGGGGAGGAAAAPFFAPAAGAGAAFAPAALAAHRMDTSDAVEAHGAPALPMGVEDVDGDASDPALVSEYAADIHLHQKAAEDGLRALNPYMAHQTDINEKMRAILLDWLEEVHVKFKLMPETLFLTQNLLDRFLEKKLVARSKLQLVGVTAMLVASKYEEIYAPEVRDFVYITDKAYTREQILAMEASMLNALDFRVSAPTVYVFLNRYLKAATPDPRLTLLATYIAERQLQEYRMLKHAPSRVAAAAVNMAMRTLRGRASWGPTMDFHSGYSQAELRPVISDLQEVMAAAVTSSLQAVRKKYLTPRFGEVANIPIAPLDA